MADEGYWRAKAHRAPKPTLKAWMLALGGLAAAGLGVALAEFAPPFFPDIASGWIMGQSVTSVIVVAIVLGLAASLGGWGVLEGLAGLRGKARPEPSVFLFLAPAGAAGAIACAFLLPGPLDDRLTDARVTDSWGHYVATLQFDESISTNSWTC